MRNESGISITKNNSSSNSEKKEYQSPVLRSFGKLNRLTQGSGGPGNDGGGVMTKKGAMNMGSGMNMTMTMSDRKTKENIIKIDTHPLGIGLYLFDYKAEFCDNTNNQRQFGVMADEVEQVMPSAVSIGENGYKHVDYNQLNIQLNH